VGPRSPEYVWHKFYDCSVGKLIEDFERREGIGPKGTPRRSFCRECARLANSDDLTT
jgi:hypothetical protein